MRPAPFLLFFICLFYLPHGWAESATDIVNKSDQQMRGESSYSVATMRIIRPDWIRSMSMKSWTKNRDFSLVLVTSPAKDKGTVSLKRYREMWNWIPAIERVIKIAPSMLSQSWMGSDFTNDDLINQSSIVVDYEHKLVKEELFDGEMTYVIDAVAKPDAPVVWSRIRLWVSKQTYLQRKAEFYDEFEDLVNTMQTFDIQEMGGRMLATHLEMIPADKPGYKTEFITHEAQFDFAIGEGFFSLDQMKQLRD
ncbi:outer membrane lipoprotein-sorting protein [Vibrio albus]|uniref:Outer membrane lipoprotein-sorting protein n=1 Tax=Vibrio albus TaxID=2200953 RepID=A0A2U3B935_9VIBR|nr:outer membrane lipoprotein-sorting protein [Vibrio albus]PWI33293.1 outer membrane lipoprotein-sorting protein [Vibrio albus]